VGNKEEEEEEEEEEAGNKGDVCCRVCHPFSWGSSSSAGRLSGRLPLRDYVRYAATFSKADAPFYVFESDVGGGRHMVGSYGPVDDHCRQRLGSGCSAAEVGSDAAAPCPGIGSSSSGGGRAVAAERRHSISLDYEPPSLFR
jgi:hypothetical protein